VAKSGTAFVLSDADTVIVLAGIKDAPQFLPGPQNQAVYSQQRQNDEKKR